MSLDAIFDEGNAEEVTAEPEMVETVEEVTEDSKPEEAEAVPTAEEDPESHKVPLAAVKDERQKRQQAVRDYEQLKNDPEALKAALAKFEEQQKEVPDPLYEPEKYADHLRGDMQQQLAKHKLDISRELMAEAHDDYEEMENLFVQMAEENPMLAAKAQTARNIPKFAYEQAKKYKQFQEFQGIDDLRAKIRAEIEAELKGDQAISAKQRAVSNLKPSLAKATSANKDTEGKATLEDLFDR